MIGKRIEITSTNMLDHPIKSGDIAIIVGISANVNVGRPSYVAFFPQHQGQLHNADDDENYTKKYPKRSFNFISDRHYRVLDDEYKELSEF